MTVVVKGVDFFLSGGGISEDEIFRELEDPSLYRYLISNRGQVYSRVSNKLLTTQTQRTGYQICYLRRIGEKKNTGKLIHELVAGSFIDNPNGLEKVIHKDFNRANNHANNLEWATSRQHCDHTIKVGRYKMQYEAPQGLAYR